MSAPVVVAVDIGASGGRVMAGRWTDGDVVLDTVHRFANAMVETGGHLRWPIRNLFTEVVRGLAMAVERYGTIASIGIDTWAVDYGLLDGNGELLDDPVAYRDPRVDAAVDEVHRRVHPDELFAVNGLQFLPFNTCYQLAAERHGPLWERASTMLLVPDLLAYWLTGNVAAEYTNATTTGLVDVHTGNWSGPLLAALSIPAGLLPPIERPGSRRGTVLAEIAARTGLDPATPVVTVGSHDTASAVAAVPARSDRFAYVSCGTWSLVGVELDDPLTTGAARSEGFTNEGGVDGRIRFLRNVGGLWLLQECLRQWEAEGRPVDLDAVLAEASTCPSGPIIDVDDVGFIAPGNMPQRIADAVRRTGGRVPGRPAEFARCICESLARAYAATIDAAARVSGIEVDVVHLVGGGSQNSLLCQLAADRCAVPVVAGPVEATALGNVLVQMRALGWLPPTLEALRSVASGVGGVRTYLPSS